MSNNAAVQQREKLTEQMRQILRDHRQGTIVLCEDGRETNRTFAINATNDKSPVRWLNVVMLDWHAHPDKPALSVIYKN